MKRFLKILPAVLLLAVGLSLTTNTWSQEQKLTRKEKKAAHKEELKNKFRTIDRVLNDKTFVVKADFLENNYGNRVHVSDILNFIRVDTGNVVFQVGSYNGLGLNGVGGITAEGNLDRWKVYKDDKNMSFDVLFTTVTNIGVYDISMKVAADGYTRATITGLRNGSLTYSGYLMPTEDARVYKGQNTL
jgi:hypothetical protein